MIHTLFQIFKIILSTSSKNKTAADNPPIRIYLNKIENRIKFRIKKRYYLELLTPETMKLPGSIKNKITKDKVSENMPSLEITEAVLVHYDIINNDYQQCSRVLYIFVSKKLFGQLFDILPKNFISLKTFNLKFPYSKLWFTDRNSKPLEIKDKVNITLVIN